jgi:tetratricopeptide (TPR) repeat protein
MVTEVIWLKSNFYNRKREYSKASEYIKKILQIDPWSVAYLIQEIVCLSNLTHEGHEENLDKIIEQLKQGEETAILWDDFDETTDHYASTHRYEIVYARQKLRFLYSQGDYAQLQKLVKAGTKFDAMKSAGEFIRLLNTNFDGPNIYYALGLLFKELWQLETSSMWFKQLLLHYQSDDEDKRKAYLELGDNYTWQNTNLQKAIEYLKLAMEMGERENEQAIIYLAHAYMRSGKMQEARIYLNLLEASRDVEAIYVKGLYQYRNGAREEASAIWKPLLTMRIDQIKFHHLKQEIMRYDFDHQPYLKAN